MRHIFSILLLLICLLNYGQTYSDLVTDKEILDFLKWESKNTPKSIFDNHITKVKRVCDKPTEWGILLEISDTIQEKYKDTNIFLKKIRYDLDTVFSVDDFDFIQFQSISHKKADWSGDIPKTKFKSCLFKDRGKYYYSIPVFSKDKRFVIFRKSYYCGSLCGESEIVIYKRVSDNDWERYIVISSGFS